MARRAQKRIPNALTIAGLDPSGGAGLLADVKAMSANGAYACGVLTAVTMQNTRGVFGVTALSGQDISAQMDRLFEDVRIDAVKIGMLGNAEIIQAVAAGLQRWRPAFVVLDPVMVGKSGDRLLEEAAVSALVQELLPFATVITPNLPEAADLLGEEEARTKIEMQRQAAKLHALMGPQGWVLLKGGHLEGDAADDWLEGADFGGWLPGRRVATKNTHGTGCTLSSALAALLPQCSSVPEACREAKAYIAGAIAHADDLDVGSGHGPTNHFWALWPSN